MKKKPYLLSITLGDLKLTGKGATMYEALTSIQRPVKITTKAFITVTQGSRKLEQMFMPQRAKRLFYPLAQSTFAKQFEFLLQ